jgi:hypothetical protein
MARQSDGICAEGYCLERGCVTRRFARKQLVRLLRGLVIATQVVVLED